MPPKQLPKCVDCQKTDSLLWRNEEQCQECFEEKNETKPGQEITEESKETVEVKEEKTSPEKTPTVDDKTRLRKSTRATRFKAKSSGPAVATNPSNGGGGGAGGHTTNAKSQKGRNRRNLFKRQPLKLPAMQATTHMVESVFYKDSYLQVGDIVSLVDNDGNVYYAQIRGLLIDDYCEKSAYLTWLIPTQASPDPNREFDAATYLIGPDEDRSRKLSCLEFVMHAPSNYYYDRTTPFPLPDAMQFEKKAGGFIWTNLDKKKACS